MAQWTKIGRIFCPDHHHPWMVSHASNPTIEIIKDDLARIYFSCRNEKQQSSIGSVDINLQDPLKVLKVSDTPVMSPPSVGHFDDAGLSIGCFVPDDNGALRLYYMGWNIGGSTPWRNSIGFLVREKDKNNFKRFSAGPVMDRSPEDPYSLSYPWVIREDSLWKMWYGSHLSWGSNVSDMDHGMKYATSKDGIHWKRNHKIILQPDHAYGETGMARPCVLKDQDGYKMWYARKTDTYRIGYATSENGQVWTRKDDLAGIDISDNGWDSEMITYPCVFDHKGQRYMLYAGNGYGQTGFGLAVLG